MSRDPIGEVGQRDDETTEDTSTDTTGGDTAADESTDTILVQTNEEPGPGSRFNGLPGEPEVWRDSTTGTVYIVYEVPGTEPPIPLMFTVPTTDDLQSFFGEGKPIVYDRTMSSDEIMSTGALLFGSTDTIPEKEGSAWAGFMERMERAIEVQPWLEDDEVFAIFAGAWLEGRPVEEWELQTTNWYQTHNQAERDWLLLNASDPASAAQLAMDNSLAISSQVDQLGLEMSQDAVDWIANQLTTGHWSSAYTTEQLYRLAGGKTTDDELNEFLSTSGEQINTSELYTTQVRDLWNEWLGPSRQPRDEQVTLWADRFRRAPEASRDELITMLKRQRQALLPEYEDPNLSYQDIAANWRNTVARAWGQPPDETDPFFLKILRANDSEVAEQLLRKEGVKRGNQTILNELDDALTRVTGGNVIGAR